MCILNHTLRSKSLTGQMWYLVQLSSSVGLDWQSREQTKGAFVLQVSSTVFETNEGVPPPS